MTIHQQSPTPNWPDALLAQLPGTWNKFFQVQACAEAKSIRPDTHTVFRYHVNHQDQYVHARALEAAARAFINRWFDKSFLEHAASIDAVEGLNEIFAPQSQAQPAAWCAAFAKVWNNEYRNRHSDCHHIKPVLGNIAVGNDAPTSVAQAAVTYDGFIGYHPYWPVRNGVRHADQLSYSLRWQRLDREYQAAGYSPNWLFTEAGPIGFVNPDNAADNSLDGRAGWRHPSVHNGDEAAHLGCWRWFARAVRAWNQKHGNRAHGAVAFTTHHTDDGTWKHFLIAQPHLTNLAAAVAEAGGFTATIPDPTPHPKPKPKPKPTYTSVTFFLPQDATWRERQRALSNAREFNRTITHSHHEVIALQQLPMTSADSYTELHGRHKRDVREFLEQHGAAARYHAPWQHPPPRTQFVDVSRWQDPALFDAAEARAAGIDGIYIRSSYGTTTDKRWQDWLQFARTHKFKIGAYHWISPAASGTEQAELFAWLCATALIDWTPAADVERGPSGQPAPHEVRSFVEHFGRIASQPLIYTGHGAWKQVMQSAETNWARDHGLWLAAHTTASTPTIPQPWSHYVAWQHTVSSTRYYPNPIDQNRTPSGPDHANATAPF